MARKPKKPKRVEAAPVVYRVQRQQQPTDETRQQTARIQEELVEFIKNGGPEMEDMLLEKMRTCNVKPTGSLLVWALDDGADASVLRQLHEIAVSARKHSGG